MRTRSNEMKKLMLIVNVRLVLIFVWPLRRWFAFDIVMPNHTKEKESIGNSQSWQSHGSVVSHVDALERWRWWLLRWIPCISVSSKSDGAFYQEWLSSISNLRLFRRMSVYACWEKCRINLLIHCLLILAVGLTLRCYNIFVCRCSFAQRRDFFWNPCRTENKLNNRSTKIVTILVSIRSFSPKIGTPKFYPHFFLGSDFVSWICFKAEVFLEVNRFILTPCPAHWVSWKLSLEGSKDEHFSCFPTSCQTGLKCPDNIASILISRYWYCQDQTQDLHT